MDGTTSPWVESGSRLQGVRLSTSASAERRPEALCAAKNVTDRTSIYGGRPPTQAQWSPWRITNAEVKKAQDQPLHGSCRSFDINNRRLVASRTCIKSTCFYRNGDDWSATVFNEVEQHDVLEAKEPKKTHLLGWRTVQARTQEQPSRERYFLFEHFVLTGGHVTSC